MMDLGINTVIDKKTITTHLKVKDKAEALKKLATLLFDNGYLKNIDGYLKDVYIRETQGSTGIGEYVAIPHGKSSDVAKIGVAIGILDDEIQWETLDDHGVKVIILFAVSDDHEGAREHLKMLSLFAKKLGKSEVIKKLLKSNNAKDVVMAFED